MSMFHVKYFIIICATHLQILVNIGKVIYGGNIIVTWTCK